LSSDAQDPGTADDDDIVLFSPPSTSEGNRFSLSEEIDQTRYNQLVTMNGGDVRYTDRAIKEIARYNNIHNS
jgi:hypothetical protein